MIASQNIIYLPGTRVLEGGFLLAYIAPSGPWCVVQSAPDNNFDAFAKEIPVQENSSGYRLFPNPTSGMVTIQSVEKNSTQQIKAVIYNILGKEIISTLFSSGSGHTFMLNNQPSGVYILKLYGNNETTCFRIIRQF
jgi:hypothetical protein